MHRRWRRCRRGAGRYAPLDGSRGLTVVVASDVRTQFLDAAAIYGPQKGATADQVAQLTERLERVAEGYRRDYGVDVRTIAAAERPGDSRAASPR